MNKSIEISPITRVHGCARLSLDVEPAGEIRVHLEPKRPGRWFEESLQGRPLHLLPWIAARLCGTCSVPHQLASAKAVEAAYNIEIPPMARILRRITLLGHIIEEHSLSFFTLAGPDLIFGLSSPIEKKSISGLVRSSPDTARKALRLRAIGRRIIEIAGGKQSGGFCIIPGGIAMIPQASAVKELVECAKEALKIARLCTVFWKKVSEVHRELIETFVQPAIDLAMTRDEKMEFYDGDITCVSAEGKSLAVFPAQSYEEYLDGGSVPDRFKKDVGYAGPLRVGALARVNCSSSVDMPLATAELIEFREKSGYPVNNILLYHRARIIEMLYACEKIGALIEELPRIETQLRVPLVGQPSRGIGAIEAPSGLLIHDYGIDDAGQAMQIKILGPTSFNFKSMVETICQGAKTFLAEKESDVPEGIEMLIRCYDPCFFCGEPVQEELLKNS